MWPIHKLEGQAEAIQDVLMAGLGDSDQDTRCWARKAYWAFAVHFRVEADMFLSSLDPARRQILEGEGHDGSSPIPGISGSRSRQSSVTRSQDSLDGTRVSQYNPHFNSKLTKSIFVKKCSSESNFERGGRRSSNRVNRGYGSLDHG